MKRFSLLAAEMVAALGLVFGVALMGRHATAPPESVLRWHFTKCDLPCWGGIVPGSTSLDETKAALSQMFAAPAFSVDPGNWVTNGSAEQTDLYLVAKDTDPSLAPLVTLNSADGVTTAITIEGNTLPSLGEMLALLGPPSCVGAGVEGTDFLMLYYTDRSALSTIELDVGPHDILTQSVGNLQIYPSEPSTGCPAQSGWHGLAHASFYRNVTP